MDIPFIIFLITYIFISIGQVPFFRVDRTGISIIGATLLILLNVISINEAYLAIDYKTIIILFGMMVLIANLRLSGFFHILLNFIVKNIKDPKNFLYILVFISGISSAFFVNDTICLIFTPFVIEISRKLNLNPKPYLLALAMSSNIGSVATITGNPQNIIIASFASINYSDFFIKMFPITLINLITCILLIQFFYKKDLTLDFKNVDNQSKQIKYRYNKALLIKSSIAALLTIILFFLNVPMYIVSIFIASFLLITRRIKPEKVYNLIDFSLLILFICLFVIIKGSEKSIIFMDLMSYMKNIIDTPLELVISTVILSNLVSNVPAVLVLKEIVNNLTIDQNKWYYLSMASTLAGNLTIFGSIANIIVIELASSKVKINFLEYIKIGIPLTIITVALTYFYLSLF
jgi:Na+/H+ antiporter NhaD/arsenite permease-like protein